MTDSLSPPSQLVLRHKDFFAQKQLLVSGAIQDMLPTLWSPEHVMCSTNWYPSYEQLKASLGDRVEFSMLPGSQWVRTVDAVIYFWPKSKQEAVFQLSALRSLLPHHADIFIVGENRSGVRHCKNLFASPSNWRKIDVARHSSLYHCRNENPESFDLASWWRQYQLTDTICIRSLPGVFSADHLDEGTQLLLEALPMLPTTLSGKVLDMGCGAGVIATFVAQNHAAARITLSDANANALVSCQETLRCNGLSGKIIASNVFSAIKDQYDFILTNPPFHVGLQRSYAAAATLIAEAGAHLKEGGYLCLVANRFLPYADLLDTHFGRHWLLQQSAKFSVYLVQKNFF